MNIEREAIKFAKNFIGEFTFTELKSYVEKHIHYKVLFFDTDLAKKELFRLNMKIPKTEKGLAVNGGTSKMVFLKSNMSEDEKIQCLLHEIGHIILGHLDIPSRELNRGKSEQDAELFAYIVLANVKRRSKTSFKIPFFLLAVVVLVESVIIASNLFKNRQNYDLNNVVAASSYSDTSNVVSVDNTLSEEVYYVTTTGKKYHEADCRYVKGKSNIIALSPEQEMSNYSPCSVCNP